MAHNIQKRDIQTGVKNAWHGLTNVVECIDETNVGFLYPMEVVQCYHNLPSGEMGKSNGRQIISLDDCLPVGSVVGEDYKLIANHEIWDAVRNGLAGTKHTIVSAGTVANRSTGFISIKVLDDIVAAGRVTEPVVNILWGHGGNRSVSYRTGMTVVVCQNTYNVAAQAKMRMSVKHTRYADIGNITQEIDNHIGVAHEFQTEMNRLASIECSNTKAKQLFAGFLGAKADSMGQAGQTKLRDRVYRLTRLHYSGQGNRGETMADTFNAVTDFYTHESAGSNASSWKQFTASEFGTSSTRKQEFLGLLSWHDTIEQTAKRGVAVLASLGL